MATMALAMSGRAFGQAGREAQAAAGPAPRSTVEVSGVIRDSATEAPVSAATIEAARDGVTAARTVGDSSGRFALRLPAPGTFSLIVRRIGYRPATRVVVLASGQERLTVNIVLSAVATTLERVTVSAASPVAVDVRSGVQSYQEQDSHAAPTTTTSQLIQQAVAGAARAPTGEVHIRGQHSEFTYYVDGVPVPPGISGSLNELFDPTVAGRIDVQTGGWDAEYGNRNVAIVNVATRIPDGGFHWQASGYFGSFDANGQSVTASTNAGPLGMLLSLTRQESDMRREPVMQDSQTGAPINFHNHGEDDFAFGEVRYTPSARDRVTLDVNASRTRFAVPFDSSGGVVEGDHEEDANAFVNVGWAHRFAGPLPSAAAGASQTQLQPSELFAALYLRSGSLDYVPGTMDRPQFVFYPDTTDHYTVSEDRSATTAGAKADYTVQLRPAVAVKAGVDASIVRGHEDFTTRDSLNQPGPGVNAAVRGGDLGVYAQSLVLPSDRWELRLGARLDHHWAPLAGDQHQLSPRVRLAYFPDAVTSVWLYYGRLFIPSNVEDFHILAAAAQAGAAGLPTVPERDHYFEVGAVHRFAGGIVLKVAGYYRNDAPAVDDNTLPGTALTTTVNIAHVRVAGIESALEFHPAGPFSGYLNAALSHASAHGPITGGFLPTAYPTGWFDQDHDQRLSVVASGAYSAGWGFLSVTGIFGSGLTNGHPEAAPNETGLFDFNPAVKVAPNFIVNVGAGTAQAIGSTTARVELFVDNLFDRYYILKGAFTSGPSVGRPRSIEMRVTVGR
ncbi:MAG TPA: TonB-dependent receptor [Gemmatimonadaceae bacterium]|nr:TonB-dependent receptor [Gemmatimonadaceae bacterium]